MKKLAIAAALILWFTSAEAWGEDAMDFYKRGLESTLAYKRIEYFSKALELNPKLADAYEKRGLHYYFQQRFEKAIKDYSKAIELKPQDVEAYRRRGVSFLKSARFEEAIADFSLAIKLEPETASAHSNRAEAYRRMGMAKEAIRDATMAIQLRGDARTMANAYATRAKSNEQLGNQELSEADFKMSVELDPRYVLYRYLAGTSDLEGVRRMGLMGIIGLLFVGIFKLGLPSPRKRDRD